MGAGEAVEVDPQASEGALGTMVARPNSVQLREQLPGLLLSFSRYPRKKNDRGVD